jgi:hypothetical protein
MQARGRSIHGSFSSKWLDLPPGVIKLFMGLKWRRPFVLLARQHHIHNSTCTRANNEQRAMQPCRPLAQHIIFSHGRARSSFSVVLAAFCRPTCIYIWDHFHRHVLKDWDRVPRGRQGTDEQYRALLPWPLDREWIDKIGTENSYCSRHCGRRL